jgi:predicted kinase
MLSFSQFVLKEGINDPSIFKAVFLAGGPGSGKSFIVGKTALTALGFKVINSDDIFEKALEKEGLKPTPENIYSARGQEIRGGAKILTKTKMKLALAGRLGLIIDGTGKDYEKITRQANELRQLGYEVAMIFVNTDLDTALSRNKARQRSLPDNKVEKMWKEVQQNLGKFQNFFRQKMFIVDNSEGSNFEGAVLNTYKKIASWSKEKPSSSAANQWIKAQKEKEN